MFNNQKGFTLIELMVVVVIIGILAAIALPNFLSMQDRAKESEVKANAHTLQLSVEDFKTQSNGSKPLSTASFQNGATNAATGMCGIPVTVKNPFVTANVGTAVLVNVTAWTTANLGQIGYPTIGAQTSPYWIYGLGKAAIIANLTEGQ